MYFDLKPLRCRPFRLLACLLLAWFALACTDEASLKDTCVKVCKKLESCDTDWVEDSITCDYQCSRPGLSLNLELSACILDESCARITEICFPEETGED